MVRPAHSLQRRSLRRWAVRAKILLPWSTSSFLLVCLFGRASTSAPWFVCLFGLGLAYDPFECLAAIIQSLFFRFPHLRLHRLRLFDQLLERLKNANERVGQHSLSIEQGAHFPLDPIEAVDDFIAVGDLG